MTTWLSWKICYHSSKSLYLYLIYFELDSDEIWQVGSTNKNFSKKSIVTWKIGKYGNSTETRLL